MQTVKNIDPKTNNTNIDLIQIGIIIVIITLKTPISGLKGIA